MSFASSVAGEEDSVMGPFQEPLGIDFSIKRRSSIGYAALHDVSCDTFSLAGPSLMDHHLHYYFDM